MTPTFVPRGDGAGRLLPVASLTLPFLLSSWLRVIWARPRARGGGPWNELLLEGRTATQALRSLLGEDVPLLFLLFLQSGTTDTGVDS